MQADAAVKYILRLPGYLAFASLQYACSTKRNSNVLSLSALAAKFALRGYAPKVHAHVRNIRGKYSISALRKVQHQDIGE